METDDTITVNRAALVALVKAATVALRFLKNRRLQNNQTIAAQWLAESLAPFADLQE